MNSRDGRNPRRPSIDALRALLALADTGNVSRAAERLEISQPVVSKKLKPFYDVRACGAVLLRRAGGKIVLTEAAHAVLPAIREVVRRYDLVFNYLSGTGDAPQVVRIATGAFAAEFYLPNALASMRTTGEFRVETRICRGSERILGTAQGQFDMSIVSHDEQQVRRLLEDSRIDQGELVATKLARHSIALVAARTSNAGSELAKWPEKRRIPIHKLSQWELVGPDRQSGLRRRLEDSVSKELYFVADGGGWSAAKAYAAAGIGVAILPMAKLEAADRKSLVCRQLSLQFAVTELLLHRTEELTPDQAKTKAAIVDAAQAMQKNARL